MLWTLLEMWLWPTWGSRHQAMVKWKNPGVLRPSPGSVTDRLYITGQVPSSLGASFSFSVP